MTRSSDLIGWISRRRQSKDAEADDGIRLRRLKDAVDEEGDEDEYFRIHSTFRC